MRWWLFSCIMQFNALSKNCEKPILASSSMPVCLSVCLSVRPHGTTRLPLADLHDIWYLNIFRKSVQKIQVLLKSDKTNGHFTLRPTYVYVRWILLKMKNISHESCRESQNTHFMFNKFFPTIVENVEKYDRAGQTTDNIGYIYRIYIG
jgi:hypothetical protein